MRILVFLILFICYNELDSQSIYHPIDSATTINLKPYCPVPMSQNGIEACIGYSFGYGAMTILNNIRHQYMDASIIKENCFSPLFIFNQSRTDSADCSKGASYSHTIKLLKQKGNCLLSDFEVEDCFTLPDSTHLKKAAAYKTKTAAQIFAIEDSATYKINYIKQLLKDSIPVVINFQVFDSFKNLNQKNFHWQQQDTINDKYLGHHSLVIIGFNSKYFEVMNSWDTNWGNQGFAYLSYDAIIHHAIAGYVISFETLNLKSKKDKSIPSVTQQQQLPPTSYFPKPPKQVIERNIAFNGLSVLKQITETEDGGILAIGTNTINKKTSMVLSKSSSKGKPLFTYQSQVNKLEKEHGIFATEVDTALLLATGFTQPNRKHLNPIQNKVWLNFHQSNGQLIKRKILKKSSLNLTLEDATKSTQELIYVGIENDDLWFLITDLKGNKIHQQNRYRTSSKDIIFKTAKILVEQDKIYVYGIAELLGGINPRIRSKKKSKTAPYLLQLNKNGVLEHRILFSDLQVVKGGGIVFKNNHLYLTGTLRQKQKDHFFFIRIPKNFDKSLMVLSINDKIGFSEGIDLLPLQNNNFLIVGNGSKHKKGSRSLNITINKIDQFGYVQWESPWIYEGKGKQEVQQIIQKKDRSIWVCGSKNNGNKLKADMDFTFLNIGQQTLLLNDDKSILINRLTQKDNLLIKPREEIKLDYELNNKSHKNYAKLQIEVTCKDCPQKLILPTIKTIPILSKQNKIKHQISIKANRIKEEQTNEITVRFFTKNRQLLYEENILITSTNISHTPFEVSNTHLILSASENQSELQAQLVVELKNNSRKFSRNVHLRFDESTDITLYSPAVFQFKYWPVNEKKIIKLDFATPKNIHPSQINWSAYIAYRKDQLYHLLIQ